MPAHKEQSGKRISYDDLAQIMRLIRNPCNHPVLIHCNKGKHRTGCIVAAFRALAAFDDRTDWAPPANGDILSEYRRFSAPKNRALDEEFIAKLSPQRVYLALGSAPDFVQPTKTPNPEDPNDLFGLIEEWSRTEPGVKYVSAATAQGDKRQEGEGGVREACHEGDGFPRRPAGCYDAYGDLCGLGISDGMRELAMRPDKSALQAERERIAREILEEQL